MKLYGIQGRVISALGLIVIAVTSLQVGGAFTLIPPKINALLLVVGGVATALSERLQGGASLPEVRYAAAQSDAKNEREALNK